MSSSRQDSNWSVDLSVVALILSLPNDVLERLDEDYTREGAWELLKKVSQLPLSKWKEAGAPDYLIKAVLESEEED